MKKNKRFEELEHRLAEQNPKAVLWAGFEDALVGIGHRVGHMEVAVYDYDLMVQVLMKRDKMSQDEAMEFLEHNTLHAYMGKHTPMTLER